MEAKAIKFVKIIRRKLKSDPECQGTQLEKLFLRAVEKLPDGELKMELQGNLPRYRRLVKHKKRVLQQSDQSLLTHPGEDVTATPSVERKRNTHSLEQRQRAASTNKVKLADLCGPAELQWLADLRRNVTVTCTRTVTNKVLHATMKLYTSKVAEHLTEDALCGLKSDGLMVLDEELKRFLHFCNHCYVATEEFERPPTYHDLMAAMLSVYVDVVLISTRSKDAQKGRREAKQLANTITYLLRHSPQHILDVLLQQTQATPGDSSFILPLYKKALTMSNVNHNPALYTKYMLTARQALDLFKEESTTLHETALQVSAPAGYSEWLQEENVSVPEFEHITGTMVSKVLLDQCATDTVYLLLDMLTEDTLTTEMSSRLASNPQDITDHSLDNDQSVGRTEMSSDAPLFFIDKESTTLPIELQPSDVDLKQVVEVDTDAESEEDAIEEVELQLSYVDVERVVEVADAEPEGQFAIEKDVMQPVVDVVDKTEDTTQDVMQPVVDVVDKTEDTTQDVMQPVVDVVDKTEDTTQTPVVTPDRRIRADTKAASSAKMSRKKSSKKKTPQRKSRGEETEEFTALRSRSKDPPKPPESQVSDATVPPVDSDEKQRQKADEVAQDESDDGSVIIVSSNVACRRSCRIRRRTHEVEKTHVEEGIALQEKKKALKDDKNAVDTSEQVASKISDNTLFYFDKKASTLTVELESLDERMDGVTTTQVTPKNRRQSDVKRVLSARKSQKGDRSSKKKTPAEKSGDLNGTQVHIRRLEHILSSSPVLASGGKRARKTKDALTKDDLDDSWVVIDTPDRKSAGVKQLSLVIDRIKGEEIHRVKGRTQTTPKSANMELRKQKTPLRTKESSTPTRKRKSLLSNEMPKNDCVKAAVGSAYSLRKKSTVAQSSSET